MPETRLTMEFTGIKRLQDKLNKAAQGIGLEMMQALRVEAEIEMTEAKKRTPVDTGALRGSGHVVGPVVRGRDITVEMRFGGPAAPYAVRVHEDLDAYHRVGQAKFLESVLRESAPHMFKRVAARASNVLLGIAGA